MSQTLNLDGIHKNGNPLLKVGLRGKEFTIELKTDTDGNDYVELYDSNTGEKLTFVSSDSVTKTTVQSMIDTKVRTMTSAPTSSTTGSPGDVIFVIS